MPYAIRLPDGTLVENIPDDLPPEQAKRRIIAAGLIKAPPPPETTILGQVKEFGKGLIPGAVGLVEQAAIGASALLPEETEKAAREKIASIAGAAKAPFTVAPGYEESVGRKLGQAIGSTVPFLAAGPLGLAGRLGAVGLGVGAGAGEARTRAEESGATAEQRATATALGIAPGALEVFAPFRILSRIPDAATAQGVQLVKRAALAGGEEAAQEAASNFAQNLIAKGIYKPEQELIEGLGESAAYGGATGAIVQGLLDLALGRRARGAQAAPTETPIERAERLAAEKAAAETPPPAPPAEIPPPPDTYAELVLYSEQLKALPKSKERDAALKAAAEKRKALAVTDIETQRSAAEKAKGFMTAEEAAAAQVTPREEVTAPPVAETPAPPVEEPKVRKAGEPPATGLQPADIEALGVSKKQPIYRRMLGKDMEDPAQRDAVLADIEKYLVAGNGSEDSRTKLAEFKAKFAPTAPPTTAPEVPVTETPSAVTTQPEAGGAGAPVAGEPGAGAAPGGAGVAEPSGVVPPVTDVEQPAGGEGQQPAPVTPPAPAPTPVQVERELTALVESGRITEEQAAAYREELLGEAEEVPQTAMGQAFQKQVDSLKAQMDALRQKNGRPPAKKSPARAKYDELQAKLDAITVTESGDLVTRIEKAGLKGVVGMVDGRPVIDIAAVKDNLIKARAVPEMLDAILTYIGVDRDGHYLDTVYTSDEAAEKHGMSRKSGSNVRRAAEALGVDTEVRNRFLASQSELGVGAAKNASEEGTGATDLNPRRGALYESKKKGMPKVIAFLRGALTPDGKLDFSESRVPLESTKAKGDKKAVVGLAEMFVRASQFNRNNYKNDEVINALQAEIDKRIKSDRKKVNDAITRAYGKFTETEDVSSNQKALELQIEKDLKSGKLTPVGDIADLKAPQLAALITEGKAEIDEKLGTIKPVQKEAAAPDQTLTEEEAAEAELRAEEEAEAAVESTTRRLSDEDINYRTIPQSPVVTNRASHAELEKVVSDIGKALGGEVSVTILDDVTDVDAKQQPGTRAGALIKGQIYLFRSGIAKGIEGQKTVFHELFHKGLKNLLPEAEYRALMSRFYNQSAEVRRMADAYLASDTGKKDTEGMSPQEARVLAVEESLAEVAEQTKLKPTLVRQVGNFFARVADRFGMPQLARAIRTMGLNEQQKFIQDALQAGLGPSAGEGATRFRTITPQTEAAVQGVDVIGEQGKRTFGQRIAQDLKGNPALRLREKFTDSLAPLEDLFVNAYGGATRTAAGRLNPMVLLSRALDALRVSKAAQEIGGLGREDGLIVAKALPVSYKDILKRIADAAKERGQTYEEFRKTVDTVLYAHREYNLREKNKTLSKDEQIELLLKDPELDRLEAAFQQDDFIKGISADLDTIRFNLLDTLVDTGRISAEQAKDYRDAIGYIPFERIGEYENQWNNATRGANRGVAALKKMRSLEGSDRKSTSVVENFSGLMDWATKEAMKNEAALRALKDMELLGAAVKRPTEPAKDAPGGVVDVFDGGKKVSYYVPDPAHLVAFSIADPQLSKILKAFQRGSQVLRAGVTAMPPFAIKQVFDDVVRAYAYAGVKNNGELVKNVLFSFPKNWVNEVMRRESKGVRELKNLGIVGTFDFTQQTNLKDILEEAGAKKEGVGSAIIRVMEAGAKASDLAVREAVYKQVLKETGDKAQAESAAREIINFSRRGSSKMMGQMISIIPFFNAYARGMDKLATAAAGKVVGQSTGTARSMFYQRMTVLTTLGLAYAVMMQDDEEYNKLPDHVRDTNWVLPYGKELGFTPVIPIPAELAFFFKAIPERVLRYYKYQGTEEEQAAMSVLGELAKRGIDVFSSPNVTPQVLRPFLENIVNYSFFLGRPLESQAQLQLRPFERYGTGTSDAMKAVAKGLEDVANATGIDAFAVSPIKLENAVRGLMGTAAGLTLSMADMMVNPDRTDRPLHQQLTPQLTGASAVMKTAVGTRFMDEIYDLEKRVEQVNGTYNRLLKTQPEKAEGYLKDNIGMYSIRGPVQGVMDAIRTLNEAAMTIDRDTSLSPEERRKLIDELRAEQNEIARVVFSLRKQARDIQAGL